MCWCCCWCCCGKRNNNKEYNDICPMEYKKELLKEPNLKISEIEYLYNRFCFIGHDSAVYPPKHLKKYQFLKLYRLHRNPIFSNIINSLFGDKKVLTFVDFVRYINIFRANTLHTKPDEIAKAKQMKLKLLFKMYDYDKNGIITEHDLIKVCHKLYSDIMPQSMIFNIVSTAIAEMDSTSTGQIMFDDFCNALDVFDMDESLVIKLPHQREHKL